MAVRSASDLELFCALSSPPMIGEPVRELQLMLRHNPYGTFEPGQAEGVYDEQTAAAVRRARYWLGTPEDVISENADPLLRELLSGERELPGQWRELRERRLARAQETVLWDAVVEVAREQLGRREEEGKRTPYTLWYGLLAPWPVIFCSFCYAQAGSTAFRPGSHYAYAPYLWDDARRGRNGLSLTEQPLRGDLALVDSSGDGSPDRLAIFDGWQRPHEQQLFDAIEGDVGFEGQLAGEGAVARTVRERAHTLAFVHVRH